MPTGLRQGSSVPSLTLEDGHGKSICITCVDETGKYSGQPTLMVFGDPRDTRFLEDLRDVDTVFDLLDRDRLQLVAVAVAGLRPPETTEGGQHEAVVSPTPVTAQPDQRRSIERRARVKLPVLHFPETPAGAEELSRLQLRFGTTIWLSDSSGRLVHVDVGTNRLTQLLEKARQLLQESDGTNG